MNPPVPNESLQPSLLWPRCRCGPLVIDFELGRVDRNGESVVLQPIPLRILAMLLERPGRPVSREQLHRAIWPAYPLDSFERNLYTAMRKLRRAIGDDARTPALVETLRAKGYRWCGPAPIPDDPGQNAPAEPVANAPTPAASPSLSPLRAFLHRIGTAWKVRDAYLLPTLALAAVLALSLRSILESKHDAPAGNADSIALTLRPATLSTRPEVQALENALAARYRLYDPSKPEHAPAATVHVWLSPDGIQLRVSGNQVSDATGEAIALDAPLAIEQALLRIGILAPAARLSTQSPALTPPHEALLRKADARIASGREDALVSIRSAP